MSQYNSEYSILYGFWDAEEQGWLGSRYFVDDYLHSYGEIQGVINLDMIGWDGNNDNLVEIHKQDTTYAIDLSSELMGVNTLYNIGLTPIVYSPGTIRSDHYSFWKANVNAVLVIEGLYDGDFNIYYHSTEDRIDKFNLDYYLKCSKLAITTLGKLSNVYSKSINTPKEKIFWLEQNYPNPFKSLSKFEYALSEPSFVTIKLYNSLGQEVSTLVNEFKTAGIYDVSLTSSQLSSGVYFYTLFLYGELETKKMIVIK